MKKGWFKVPGKQDGDRNLEDQLKGLAPLIEEVGNKNILDLGCAEGLIARHLSDNGAYWVDGIERVQAAVDFANENFSDCAIKVYQGDLNSPFNALNQPGIKDAYEIVLMLAILHKLYDPSNLLAMASHICTDLIVVRLPAVTGHVIIDERSGNVPFDVKQFLENSGFALERVEKGHFDEWTGYFRRKNG